MSDKGFWFDVLLVGALLCVALWKVDTVQCDCDCNCECVVECCACCDGECGCGKHLPKADIGSTEEDSVE